MEPQPEPPELKPLLDATLKEYSRVERRDQDPVGLVHRYSRHRDREVAALFASCLAYGRVESLRAAIKRALEPLDPHPAAHLTEATASSLHRCWNDFTYRMTDGDDLCDLATAISETLSTEGSLQSLYLHRDAASTPVEDRERHLAAASDFVNTLRRRRHRDEFHRGFRYLLPDPADGSACKRLHLFFRWMGRGPDAIDLGLWDRLAPTALIMPLDTHTARICRYVGLLERKTVDQKAAVRVTRKLARLAPDDPLRYDFALCHLGISRGCIHRYSPDHCPHCPIEPACTLAT